MMVAERQNGVGGGMGGVFLIRSTKFYSPTHKYTNI